MRTQTISAKIVLTFIVSGMAFAVFGQDRIVDRSAVAAAKAERAAAKLEAERRQHFDRSQHLAPPPSSEIKRATIELRQDIRSDLKDQKAEVREEVTSKNSGVGPIRREAKDALDEARERAHEHGRKLAEEAKQSGNSHRRD